MLLLIAGFGLKMCALMFDLAVAKLVLGLGLFVHGERAIASKRIRRDVRQMARSRLKTHRLVDQRL